MGFTVEEQILAVVVGILATFLANKLGADGSNSGENMRAELREILKIKDDLREAPVPTKEVIEKAVTTATESLTAKDGKKVKLILDRLTAVVGSVQEDYVVEQEKATPGKEIDPTTIRPEDYSDVVKTLNLDDAFFVERTFKVAKVARNEDAAMLARVSPFLRKGKLAYARYLWLFSENIGDMWFVVVDTRNTGIVAQGKMTYSSSTNTGSLYNVDGGYLSVTAERCISKGFGMVLFTREEPTYASATVATSVGNYIRVYDGPAKAPFPYNRWNAFNYVGDVDVNG
jgi:hypothetical protein